MSWSVGFLAALALLLFWSVGAYNRLVRLRGLAVAAFAPLDTAWLDEAQRLEAPLLVPVATPDGPQEPAWAVPIATASPDPAQAALAACERGLLGALAQVRACLAVARSRPLQGDAMAALAAAHGVLATAQQRLELAAQQVQEPPVAPEPAPELAARLRSNTDQFNTAVTDYNDAVGQFPAVLLAWLFGFRPASGLPPA